MADDTVQVRIEGDASGAVDASKEAADAVKQSSSQMQSSLEQTADKGQASFQSLGDALEDIRGKFNQAFQATGIAIAIEGIEKVTSALEGFGRDAIEIKNSADVLGLSVEQFQGLQQAAEKGGASIEQVTHGAERLKVVLMEAADGSGAAIEKLRSLGLTVDQIKAGTTDFNSVLEILRQRLQDPATATDTLNALVKELGVRYTSAAQALKNYTGQAEGVNALNQQQINDWAQLSIQISEYGTAIENTIKKILIMKREAPTSGASGSWADPNQHGATASWGDAGSSDATAATNAMQASAAVAKQVTLEAVQNAKDAASAYKAGTEEQLAALQNYATLARQYYGSANVDTVKAANAAVVQSERELSDARSNFLEQWAQEYQSITSKNVTNELEMSTKIAREENQRVADEKRQIEELSNFAEQLDEQVTKRHIQSLKEMARAQAQEVEQMRQTWAPLANGLESSMGAAISGVLSRTTTFASAMRSIFTSMVNGLIQIFAHWATTAIEDLLIQKAIQKTTAISQITANAGIAASAAMGSVAAIPFYGWAAAPGVGAATFAEALSYTASASAAGGWDLPKGVNPMTQLHSGEMVLPEKLADVIRGMAEGGGRKGGGGDFHAHFHTLDTGTARQWLRSQPGVVAKSLRDHVRNRRS